jgi:hypothetical protein
MQAQGNESAVARPPDENRSSALARAFRTLLLIVTVAAGCYVAYGFGRLWAEWREMARSAEIDDLKLAASSDASLHAPALPLDGPWSFAQLNWNIRSHIADPAEVFQRFEAQANAVRGANESALPDVSPELVETIESLQIKPTVRGDNLLYRYERGNLMAQMAVRVVDGKEKVVALAAAVRDGDDGWQFFEFTPGAATQEFTASEQHLLPLPPGARRDGGRFADDGQPLLELISIHSNFDELRCVWQNAGWEVVPSGLGGPNDFSYLCVRGDEVVYAWSANPPSELRDLMLVRTTNSADTRP